MNSLGPPGFLLVLAVLVWVRWDEVEKIPGVLLLAESIQYLFVPIPHATGDRFSIVLAHLENDKEGAHLRLIREALLEHPEIETRVKASVEQGALPNPLVSEGGPTWPAPAG